MRRCSTPAACRSPTPGRRHGSPAATTPGEVARRAFGAAFIRLAAQAVTPRWATLGLTLEAGDPDWAERFAAATAAVCEACGVELIGGDTTRGPGRATVFALGTGSALARESAPGAGGAPPRGSGAGAGGILPNESAPGTGSALPNESAPGAESALPTSPCREREAPSPGDLRRLEAPNSRCGCRSTRRRTRRSMRSRTSSRRVRRSPRAARRSDAANRRWPANPATRTAPSTSSFAPMRKGCTRCASARRAGGDAAVGDPRTHPRSRRIRLGRTLRGRHRRGLRGMRRRADRRRHDARTGTRDRLRAGNGERSHL